jgi:hypothetical protein
MLILFFFRLKINSITSCNVSAFILVLGVDVNNWFAGGKDWFAGGLVSEGKFAGGGRLLRTSLLKG